MLSSMRNSEARDVTQALVVFLFKLRSGDSNETIAPIMGTEQFQRISDYVDSVLRFFKVDIFSAHFGIAVNTRQDLISNHTTDIDKKLHNLRVDQLKLFPDGTYLRHQKSTNNNSQRKSYSGQKKCHLVKLLTICMPDGYVVDVLGPYEANFNDARILVDILDKNEDFQNLLQPKAFALKIYSSQLFSSFRTIFIDIINDCHSGPCV